MCVRHCRHAFLAPLASHSSPKQSGWAPNRAGAPSRRCKGPANPWRESSSTGRATATHLQRVARTRAQAVFTPCSKGRFSIASDSDMASVATRAIVLISRIGCLSHLRLERNRPVRVGSPTHRSSIRCGTWPHRSVLARFSCGCFPAPWMVVNQGVVR